MGWFSDLINERKKKNEAIFEESFKNISTSVFGSDAVEEDPLNLALALIFKHYGVMGSRVPKQLNDVNAELDALLARHNLMTRSVRLEGGWESENTEPILAFTKNEKIPVALFPKGQSSYYFFHPKTGKKTIVTAQILDHFEEIATTFYHPLPQRRLTLKDYNRYLFHHIKIFDIVLVVLLAALALAGGLTLPYLTKIATGEVISRAEEALFWNIATAMIGVAVGVLLIQTLQSFVKLTIANKVEYTAHSALMMRLFSLPASFFKTRSTGELNNRVNSVSLLCSTLISDVFVAGITAIFGLAYLGQIASFSVLLMIPSLAVVSINIAFTVFASFAERKFAEKQAKLYAEESGVCYDLIQGIQKIRLTGSEKRAFAKWADYYSRAARLEYNPPKLVKFAPVVSAFISAAGGILIYVLAVDLKIDTATFVAFTTSYGTLSASVVALTNVFTSAMRIRPKLEMIRPILEAEPENTEGKKNIEALEGNIELRNVSFRYEENGPTILDDLSIKIHKGEYVAIVGKTGCGKSTIVRLLLGFERPNQGGVYFDGVNIDEVNLPSLRSKIGSVTQNGTLFHADIFHNIIISAPDLTEADAWEAAKTACIDEDIRKMPMKMHTVISEGQGSISGGQKQRIMIARAIVHKPKVVIFDEATSALDNQVQREVAEAVGRLECTRIVIAHRLSTIRKCDRILYLEGGKVVEEGTYDELLALNGRFKELIERQKIN